MVSQQIRQHTETEPNNSSTPKSAQSGTSRDSKQRQQARRAQGCKLEHKPQTRKGAKKQNRAQAARKNKGTRQQGKTKAPGSKEKQRHQAPVTETKRNTPAPRYQYWYRTSKAGKQQKRAQAPHNQPKQRGTRHTRPSQAKRRHNPTNQTTITQSSKPFSESGK